MKNKNWLFRAFKVLFTQALGECTAGESLAVRWNLKKSLGYLRDFTAQLIIIKPL